MMMHGCDDNDIMVFKLVEALRGPALEYYNSFPVEIRGQLSTICTLFEGNSLFVPGCAEGNEKSSCSRVLW